MFIKESFCDVFEGLDSICVIQDDDIDIIQSDIHEVLIFKNVNEQNIFDNTAIWDDQKYELQVVVCMNYVYETNYDACIYSCHGDCHSEWWYQKKKDGNFNSFPIQVDTHSLVSTLLYIYQM